MMRAAAIIIATLALASCGRPMSAQEMAAAIKDCKDHGLDYGVREQHWYFLEEYGPIGAIFCVPKVRS